MSRNLLSFVLERLDQREPPWVEVARSSGVPYDTLKKIATRRTPNPGVQHVQRLADFFTAREHAVAPAPAPAAAVASAPPDRRVDHATAATYANTLTDRRVAAGE